MSLATYHFVPSLRRGLASAISQAPTGSRAGILMRVELAGRKLGTQDNDLEAVEQEVQLLGPGDVLGFDPEIVVRTDPKPGVGDTEDNFLPAVEFSDPEFLWRFNAGAADAEGRLRPWLTLVVLDVGDDTAEFEPGPQSARGLPPSIRVLDHDASLPDLEHSARWAHVQAVGDDTIGDATGVAVAAVNTPELVLCRLLCARRLRSRTRYSAFVVPTFELGRCAGLGIEPADGTIATTLSWKRGAGPNDILLPVYYRWDFQTGVRGDFEYLVRLLEPRQEIEGLGQREMSCHAPGLGIAPVEVAGAPPGREAILGFEGALQRPSRSDEAAADGGAEEEDGKSPYTVWGLDIDPPQSACRTALATLLNSPMDDIRTRPPAVVVAPSAPPIRDVAVTQLENVTSMRVSWQTDDLRSSIVEFGPAGAGRELVADATPKTVHALVISGLAPGGRYLMRVKGIGADGVVAETADASIEMPQLPSVTPPIYGGWHAAQRVVDAAENGWVHELNLDPRHRGAAGQGSAVVRRDQEALMASAWEQLGEIDRANDVLRRAQLGRDASHRLWERLTHLGDGALLGVTAPVHPRTILELGNERVSAARRIAEVSRLPAAALAPAFRRIARARGPIRKRQKAWTLDVVKELGRGSLAAAGPTPRPAGMADICAISELLKQSMGPSTPPDGTPTELSALPGRDELRATFLATLLAVPQNFLRLTTAAQQNFLYLVSARERARGGPALGPIGDEDGPLAGGTGAGSVGGTGGGVPGGVTLPDPTRPPIQFCDENMTCRDLGLEIDRGVLAFIMSRSEAQAIKAAVCTALNGWLQVRPPTPALPTVSDAWMDDIREEVLRVLQPRWTIPRRVRSRLRLANDVPAQKDLLDPIMWAPMFPQPMYEPLRNLSQDFVLPGVKHVPQNTVILLQTNRRFLESYMVGLNHEMAGELLWRGYPTDQRGSYFRQFWDVRERIPTPVEAALTEDAREERYRDVAPIHQWGKFTRLTKHSPKDATGDSMVLLIRGELFRRYPNTVVYAVPAVSKYWTTPAILEPKVPALAEFLEETQDAAAQAEFLAKHPKLRPIFRGDLPPDLTFFGFPLPPDTADDYFFVLEERVSEPRFGLDLPTVGGPTVVTTWQDLAWDHLVPAGGPADGWHIDGRGPTLPAGSTIDARWWTTVGLATSAQIAWATMQAPVRIAIPGSMILPPE